MKHKKAGCRGKWVVLSLQDDWAGKQTCDKCHAVFYLNDLYNEKSKKSKKEPPKYIKTPLENEVTRIIDTCNREESIIKIAKMIEDARYEGYEDGKEVGYDNGYEFGYSAAEYDRGENE